GADGDAGRQRCEQSAEPPDGLERRALGDEAADHRRRDDDLREVPGALGKPGADRQRAVVVHHQVARERAGPQVQAAEVQERDGDPDGQPQDRGHRAGELEVEAHLRGPVVHASQRDAPGGPADAPVRDQAVYGRRPHESRRVGHGPQMVLDPRPHGWNAAYPMWNVSVWPSTAMACPLIMRAASEARNRHRSAISAGCTKRAIDWPSRYSRSTSDAAAPRAPASRAMTPRMRSPSTEPGQTAFARTPCGPSSIASVLVRPITAHLAATYGARRPIPCWPAVEEMLMIDPLPAAFMAGTTRAHVR